MPAIVRILLIVVAIVLCVLAALVATGTIVASLNPLALIAWGLAAYFASNLPV